MPATFKIQVNHLTDDFVQDLKEKYGEAELEITVNRTPDFVPLRESDFWEIIDLLDFTKEKPTEILAAAIEKLAAMPVAYIYSFEDLLSEKLYTLDQKKFAKEIGKSAWKPDRYFSPDSFLYIRACVVANGKKVYEAVLKNPENMPKGMTFEPILSLAAKAYERKTGNEFFYNPVYNYETYANKKGWS